MTDRPAELVGRYEHEKDYWTTRVDLYAERFRLESSAGGEWGSTGDTYEGIWRVDGDTVVLEAQVNIDYSWTAVEDEPTESTTPSDKVFRLGITSTGLVHGNLLLERKP